MKWNDLVKEFTFLPEEIQFNGENELSSHYGVKLPESYGLFLQYFGAGTLGDFFQFLPPGHMNTHRERIGPLVDGVDDEFIEMIDENDSGDILIFATTDNGDMFGWKLKEMSRNKEPIIYEIARKDLQVREKAIDVNGLLTGLVKNPPDHLLKMQLTHIKRCS